MGISKLMNQSFLTRAVSGIVLVIILLAAGLIGGDVLFAFMLAISLIGVSEMLGVLDLKKSLPGYVAYASVVVYYLLLRFFETEYTTVFILGFLMVVLAVYVFTYPKFRTEEILLTFFSVVYAAVLMSFVYLVRIGNDGNIMVWLIFLCSWGCDTCAYLAGVMFGNHKMAPILSPKKTIEGAIGGVAGAVGLGALYGFILQDSIVSMDNPVLLCGIICGIGALISMVGDLVASAVKRNYEIKDYGTLIPGHGGILDRFDSVLFTAPVIYYLITFFA